MEEKIKIYGINASPIDITNIQINNEDLTDGITYPICNYSNFKSACPPCTGSTFIFISVTGYTSGTYTLSLNDSSRAPSKCRTINHNGIYCFHNVVMDASEPVYIDLTKEFVFK
jgi:hypothetical protein